MAQGPSLEVYCDILQKFIAIVARSHLPFFKIFLNLVHFWPNFQIFYPFLTFFYLFFGKSHALPYFLEWALGNLLKVLVCLFLYFESNQVILLWKVSKKIKKNCLRYHACQLSDKTNNFDFFGPNLPENRFRIGNSEN